MEVPFVALHRQYLNLQSELLAEFDRIGRSGVYIMGEVLERFEAEIAKYCEVPYALGVANGSDALFLILKALDIGPGDEVITCPNSFIATAWAIVHTGAKPVFVDSSEDFNIDPDQIKSAITSRTKAIVPVHLTGRPASMHEINNIAKRYGISVVEDAAQAIGARYYAKRVGSLGDAAGFSMHPLKNLGLFGDAGVITTNSFQIFEKIKLLRNHGLKNRDECKLWGYNSRLDPLQAAFGLVKLKYLDVWNARCRSIASHYRSILQNFVQVPLDTGFEEPVYHNFVIRSSQREDLAAYLLSHGIGTRVHYPIPIHLQECAGDLGYQEGDFRKVESQAKSMLSLPIYPELSDDEVDYVGQTTKSFFNRRQ